METISVLLLATGLTALAFVTAIGLLAVAIKIDNYLSNLIETKRDGKV